MRCSPRRSNRRSNREFLVSKSDARKSSVSASRRKHKMGTTLDALWVGFSVALQPSVLWYAFLGCVVGTLVGVLPGIGPLAGISILLPITFGLDATQAVIMLAGIYYGSQYGGLTPAHLMRIPGANSAGSHRIDGHTT